jgi:hypothetical protein
MTFVLLLNCYNKKVMLDYKLDYCEIQIKLIEFEPNY